MAPYTVSQRREIREALSEASVRRLGRVMMGSDPAPNHVYNAAASLATALLGGPEGMTAAILALDPSFSPISSRRYMLAPRNVTGDNEASASALAAVLGRLASGTVPGVDPATVEAIRGAIIAEDVAFGLEGRHHSKGGSLNSDPLTRVFSGWWEPPGSRPIVYTVMLSQPGPGALPRVEAGDRLEQTAERLTTLLLRAAEEASRDR
ncbi:hypothetical protein TsocGM_18180 [Tautonia sociabilis]|uniref:Penicillin-binding protein transpeptidase domain-containing protein n=2 Tax=Tautonia sociabilis TaxID=2080755 RepID=A0A432MGC3_9BACT|nr:hypothetical protein TsocGM_18180 [Tautonia sociabilis]